MKTNIYIFIISSSVILRLKNFFRTEIVHKIKTHILCSITFFPENRAVCDKI